MPWGGPCEPWRKALAVPLHTATAHGTRLLTVPLSFSRARLCCWCSRGAILCQSCLCCTSHHQAEWPAPELQRTTSGRPYDADTVTPTGSDYPSLLLAQLDAPTKKALLPCEVQANLDWRPNNRVPYPTWSAAACMARCARSEGCIAYVFASPLKSEEQPGRSARPQPRPYASTYRRPPGASASTWPDRT